MSQSAEKEREKAILEGLTHINEHNKALTTLGIEAPVTPSAALDLMLAFSKESDKTRAILRRNPASKTAYNSLIREVLFNGLYSGHDVFPISKYENDAVNTLNYSKVDVENFERPVPLSVAIPSLQLAAALIKHELNALMKNADLPPGSYSPATAHVQTDALSDLRQVIHKIDEAARKMSYKPILQTELFRLFEVAKDDIEEYSRRHGGQSFHEYNFDKGNKAKEAKFINREKYNAVQKEREYFYENAATLPNQNDADQQARKAHYNRLIGNARQAEQKAVYENVVLSHDFLDKPEQKAGGRSRSKARPTSARKTRIMTGPKGGKYYVKNGRKVYI
jgi:hypothetical protein